MSNRCCSGSGLSYSDKLICLYIGKRVSLHYPPKTAGYSSAFLANRKEMQLSQNCSTTIGKYLCVHLQFFLARISQIRHSLHEEGKIKKDLLLLLPSIFSFPPFSSKKCFDLQRNKQCLNCVLGLNNIENQYNGSRCSLLERIGRKAIYCQNCVLYWERKEATAVSNQFHKQNIQREVLADTRSC